MSTFDILTSIAYGWALGGALLDRKDMGKITWQLWAVLILLAHIAGKMMS